MTGIMDKGRRMSIHQGTGARGMPPPSTPTPEGSAPRGEENTTEKEHVAVGDVMGDVMGMMRYDGYDGYDGYGCLSH